MQLHQIFSGIAVFAFMLIGSILILGGLIDTYDVDTSVEGGHLGTLYNLSQDLNNNLSTEYAVTKNATLLADVEGGDQSENSLIKGAYKASKNAPNTAKLSVKIVNAVAAAIGVPAFVVQTFTILLGISLVFAVIYLIFRFKG